jgi:oligopeptide/dipeptide ABC transporter ATP-binding protein
MNPQATTNKPLLQVKNLVKHFPIKKGVFSKVIGHVKAVDGISFNLYPGETLGLVGESGCGKTTVGRTILNLIPATSGEVYFNDSPNLLTLNNKQMQPYRRYMQMVFQDPFSSLNPRMTIGNIISEGIKIHDKAPQKTITEKVAFILESVGLNPDYMSRYPHELSGGPRPRIGIARALALNPQVIIADEPVSSLDVSIQAQIINLFQDLQDKFNLSYVFITHDLRVVEHLCSYIAVMYLGQIVESGNREDVFTHPKHPYTKALLSAIPQPIPQSGKKKIILQGDVPNPANPPSGCRFHTRCPIAQFPLCREKVPEFVEKSPGHCASCHLAN